MSKFKAGDKIIKVSGSGTLPIGTVVESCGCNDIKHTMGVTYIDTNEWELHTYPNPPHKHAELIKAWADGATIEHQGEVDVWNEVLFPAWHHTAHYRIKPTPPPTIPVIIDGKTVELDLASAQAVKEALKDL